MDRDSKLRINDEIHNHASLPPELFHYWQQYPYIFGEFLCRFNHFMAATGTYSSVLTVVAFSLERYEAICHPLRARSRPPKRVVIVLCAVWTISAAAALPIFHVYNLMKNVHYPPPDYYPVSASEAVESGSELSAFCGIPNATQYNYYDYFYTYTSVIFFFVPMVVLILAYTNIALFMRKNLQLSRNCGIQNSCSENRRTFKMLAAVVLAFFICGAPYHYQRVFTRPPRDRRNDDNARRLREIAKNVLVATSFFYYFSATINPILYNVMSKRYRKAFKEIFWMKSDSQENTTTRLKNIKSSSKSTTTQTQTLITH